MKSLINFFARQGLFSELLTILVIGFGLYTLLNIKKETFPNVQYDVITIYTIFPGAAPSEVEKLITNPIEQALKEVDGIKKTISVSTEGRSGIFLILDPDQVTQEEAKSDVQDVIDRIRDLPTNLESDPVVEALESKIFPVIEVAVSGGKDEFHLKETARWLEDEIEQLPQVAKVELKGEQEYEVKVEISAEKLRAYQLSLTEVVEALKQQNISIPGGTFTQISNGIEKDVIVRTEGQFTSPEDVKKTVLRANDLGRPIVLGDIAKVFMSLKKASTRYRVNDKDSIRLVVSKKEKADAIDLVDDLKVLMTSIPEPRLEKIEIEYINDMSILIRRRLGVLSNNMIVGLVLVILVLSVFLPLRVSLVTAIGIPFSFLGCIAYFYLAGVSLNLITMMGLIIVIGMLVDDAVVVTENAVRRMEDGEEPMDAAIHGTQQIWRPVFASVMTTVLAFYPMTIMTGVFGKFIAFIPIGVICALLISLLECYFVLPYHIGRWVRLHHLKKPESGFKYYFEKAWASYTEFYGSMIAAFARWRYLVVAGFFAFFAFTGYIAFGGVMKQVLFPPAGVDQFIVKMKAPIGTSLEQTKELINPVEKLVLDLPKEEVINFVTSVGEQQARPDEPAQRGSHYAQIQVFLTAEDARERSAFAIIEALRNDYKENENLQVLFERINPGPPVGKPISIGVQGDTYEEIMPMVNDIMEQLKAMEGVKDLDTDYSQGKDQLIVTVRPEEARSVGLSAASVGTSVLAAFEGQVASTIKELDDEIDIRVSLPEAEKKRNGIGKLQILNPQGRLITLDKVADFELEKGVEAYYHKDNKRTVTILGEVDTKIVTATEVAKKVTEQEKAFKEKYPKLNLIFGGEEEDTQESLESLKRAFLMAVILIYFLLILTFQSFLWPIIIIMAIPIGVISVVWALFLHGQPLSFMGMLGVVALAGVIVNNAIVMVDFVRDQRRQGLSLRKSIVVAGKMRLRPIFLTTFTTVFGILPTAYGIGGLDPFVVPIAISLGWGMFIGSILSSFFLPAFIAIFDDLSALGGKVTGRSTAPHE